MASISSLVVALLVIQGVQPFGVEDLENIDVNSILSTLETKHGPSLQIAYNRGLDAVLDFINMETAKNGKSETDLPDIDEDITKKVLFAKIRGNFVADHGVLTDLSTVRRMGDTKVVRGEDEYVVTVVLGLGSVRASYGHYRAQLGRRGPSVAGHLDAEVGTNSILASAKVTLQGLNCSVTLNEVKVIDLEGLKVKVSGSGFGPLNWLLSKVTSSFARNNKGKIIARLEEGLTKLATKSLDKISCDANPLF